MPSLPSTFVLRETLTYPNGGASAYYVRGDTAVIIDDGICDPSPDGKAFDYSLVTSRQNAYVAQYVHVYRLMREDIDELDRWLAGADPMDAEDGFDVEFQEPPGRRPADRANLAGASPLERPFEEHFANVYGGGSERYLTREYGITDLDGHTRFIDYVIRTKHGLLGIEESGLAYHHPQLIGIRRRRAEGTRSFLAVLPTGTGKSHIVLEVLARFAQARPSAGVLVCAPNSTIVADWRTRVERTLPHLRERIRVCTYGWICRHYAEFAPDHFDYSRYLMHARGMAQRCAVSVAPCHLAAYVKSTPMLRDTPHDTPPRRTHRFARRARRLGAAPVGTGHHRNRPVMRIWHRFGPLANWDYMVCNHLTGRFLWCHPVARAPPGPAKAQVGGPGLWCGLRPVARRRPNP